MNKTLKTALAVFAAAVLTSWACHGNNPNSPDEPSASSQSSTPVAAAPAPKPTPTPAPGVTLEVLQSTFDADRCTQLAIAPYNTLTQLVHQVKITNNSGEGIYSKPAIFHSDKAGCGATAEHPGNAADLVTGDTSIANGKSGTVTYTFPIPENACGAWQLDDTWRNSNTFVIGKVINSGVDCPTCEAFQVSLDITGSGATRTVTAHFKAKGNKKLHVEFGDGATADLANGESTTHTWGPGSFTVTATLSSDGLVCPQTYSVNVEQEASCKDVNTKLGFATEASSVHSANVASTYNVCLQGSWNQPPPSGTLAYGDASSDSVNTPFTKCHGYPQTGSEQNFTATLTVVRGNLSCPATLPVKVPPLQDPCDGVGEPALALSKVDQTDTTDVHTNLTFPAGFTGSIGIDKVPASGFTGGPVVSLQDYTSTFNRPVAGGSALDVNYNWSVSKGDKVCKSGSKDISIPPKNDSCRNYQAPTITGSPHASNTATQVTVDSGNVAPSGGSFNPATPFSVNRPPYGQSDTQWNTTYTLPYGPSALQCSVHKDFNGSVPHQDCQKVNVWTIKNNRHDGVYTIVIVTDKDHPASTVVKTFNLGGGDSDHFTGYNNQTLYAFFKLPDGHGHFDYHFADSERSGSCGAAGPSAQWEGDASLDVSCTCPVGD